MTGITLSDKDLRAVLDLASQCSEPAASSGAGMGELLGALERLVRCDAIFWDSFVPGPSHLTSGVSIDGPSRKLKRPDDADSWLARLPEHPIMSGLYGPVTAISDVLTTREFRKSWHYNVCFRKEGFHYEIGVELPRLNDRRSVVSFSRGPGHDFDDRDHMLLRLLRPHIDAAIRRLLLPTPALTARQLEIMRLVTEGLSNGQIARRLSTSEKTVGKHLENAYARLGAHSRAQAIALSRPALDA
jgi:DNA-binding CsgD family transcriptional regulator